MDLILGDVPVCVKTALISGIKAMHEQPADTIASMQRRKARGKVA